MEWGGAGERGKRRGGERSGGNEFLCLGGWGGVGAEPGPGCGEEALAVVHHHVVGAADPELPHALPPPPRQNHPPTHPPTHRFTARLRDGLRGAGMWRYEGAVERRGGWAGRGASAKKAGDGIMCGRSVDVSATRSMSK